MLHFLLCPFVDPASVSVVAGRVCQLDSLSIHVPCLLPHLVAFSTVFLGGFSLFGGGPPPTPLQRHDISTTVFLPQCSACHMFFHFCIGPTTCMRSALRLLKLTHHSSVPIGSFCLRLPVIIIFLGGAFGILFCLVRSGGEALRPPLQPPPAPQNVHYLACHES